MLFSSYYKYTNVNKHSMKYSVYRIIIIMADSMSNPKLVQYKKYYNPVCEYRKKNPTRRSSHLMGAYCLLNCVYNIVLWRALSIVKN